jgi:transcriptional regulator GlxA family with amidase domain
MKTKEQSSDRKKVVIVVMPDVQLLHAAGPCDVFTYTSKLLEGMESTEGYQVILASATPALNVVTNSGIPVACAVSVFDIREGIDTLIIAGGASMATMTDIPEPFYNWLKTIFPSTRRVASVCTGAFALAKAGLLDHLTATTHYDFCPELKSNYPLINVDTNPFFVRDGKVYTSGGVSSGMNLSLALVEEDFGREIALKVARKLILELRRSGNQAQFSTFLPALELKSSLVKTLRPWLLENLATDIRVDTMADRVSMSPRNFARVFLNDTGLTPAKFMEKLRVEVARKYLEDTELGIEQIAGKCGLGSMVSMRRVFLRHLSISPSYYRNTFKTSLNDNLQLES